jgi:hypothetical protein
MSNLRAVVRAARLRDEAKNAHSSRREFVRRIAAVSPEAILDAASSLYFEIERFVCDTERVDRRLKYDALDRELKKLLDKPLERCIERDMERTCEIFDEMDALDPISDPGVPARQPLSKKYQKMQTLRARVAERIEGKL